jgi:hypothetical protein
MKSRGTTAEWQYRMLSCRLIGYHEYCPNFQIQNCNTPAKIGCNTVDVCSTQKQTEIDFRMQKE